MERKYFKPRSVTWWAGFVPLGLGVFVASETVHGLSNYAAAASAMYGDVSPAVPINAGLALIGLRGAR